MKKLIIALIFTVFAAVACTSTPTASGATALPTAAGTFAWGTPKFRDEFSYTGAPDPTLWGVYNGPGHAGNGVRSPAAWNVDGAWAHVTGDSQGTTGGMGFKPDRGTVYGRWEVQMRVPSRDTEYHPVLIVWPDAGRTTANNCQEVDFSESTSVVNVDKFFLHYNCSGGQAQASKTIDMTQWHHYAVEWEPDHVTGYIDGVQWFTTTDPLKIPHDPSHLTIQLDWFPDGTTTAASEMQIAWVRFYAPLKRCGVDWSGTSPAS